jgi:hypothetical protein
MNIYLAGIGWVTDAPQGHRLRWHYPVDAIDAGGKYLGLPTTIIIERAPVARHDRTTHPLATVGYPVPWWDRHGDITAGSLVPLIVQPLPKPAQAVSFTWRGGSTRIVCANAGAQVAERYVADGDAVYVEAARIDTIVVLDTRATFEDLRTLDLFADRGLDWRPLAEIAVAGSFAADLATIGPRYEIPPTITQPQWAHLVVLANDGLASVPAQAEPGDISDWQSFLLVLGCRWEFALLGGFAFFDGPRSGASQLDRFRGDVLDSPPGTLMAYRVREPEGRADVSNLVVCPPVPAPALGVPSAPKYVDPIVRLRRPKSSETLLMASGVSLKGAMRRFSPLTQFDTDYEARLTMRWQQADPRAIGVEIEEHVSASAIAGSPVRQRRFLNRTRRPEDVPPDVSVARSFDVDFPDVMLQARARAIDAWDRTSGYSTWSPATGLTLRHEPEPPPLAYAIYDAGTVRIARAVGKPDVPDWQPDPFVNKVSGQVFIYRQTAAAQSADATFGLPVPMNDGRYRVAVSGIANLADFIGGSFSIGGFTETILAVVGSDVLFRADKTSFMPGQAHLMQDPKHPALWSKVAAFAIANLPVELVFSDPLPPPAGTAVDSYCARLAYYGRLGPAGNVVRSIRQAAVPAVPPPFTVQFLGIDYFHRTMVKITFTTPVSAGRFSVWWAAGVVSSADLASVGASGHFLAQEAHLGTSLYDVMALPIPQHIGRTVTIGVQRVGGGGVQSDFTVVPVLIPALIP